MRDSQKLLSYGFRYFETQTFYEKGITLKEHEIHYGEAESLSLGIANDVVLTFPRGYYNDIKASLEVPKQLEAPVAKGDDIGQLRLKLDDQLLYTAPLIALEEVPEAGVFERIGDFIYLFFNQLFDV